MFSLLLSSNQRRLLQGVEKILKTFTEIQEKITLVAGQDFSATTKKFQMSNNMQWMSRCSCLNRLPSFSTILLLIMIEDYFTNTTQYFCQIHIHMYRAFSAISLQIYWLASEIIMGIAAMSIAEFEELYYFVSYSFEKTLWSLIGQNVNK